MNASHTMSAMAFALVISHITNGNICLDFFNLRFLVAHGMFSFLVFIYKGTAYYSLIYQQSFKVAVISSRGMPRA